MSKKKKNTPPIAKDIYYNEIQFPVNSPSRNISFGKIPSELATDSQTQLRPSNFRIKKVYIDGRKYSGRTAGIIIEDERNLSINLDLGKPVYQPFRFKKRPLDVVVDFIVKDRGGLSDQGSITFQITGAESSPNLLSATIRGDQITMQFDDVISDTLPRLNNFTLKNGSRESKFKDVEVIASAGQVTLTSNIAFDAADNVTLNYFDLASDQSQGVIQSKSGVDLPSFSGFQLNNQTTQENNLAIDDADFEGNTINLYLNAPIGSAVPSANRFKVKAGRKSQKIVGINTDPSEGVITLTTKKSVASYESIEVSYKDLRGDQTKAVIEDKFGNDMKTVRDYEIIGFDETPPKLISAELDDNILTMEFDSIINNTKLSKNRFKVKANGKKLTVKSASAEDNDESFVNLIFQTKRNQVIDLQSEVTLSYSDPKGDQSKQVIEDLFGNDLLSIKSFRVDIV